MKIKSFLFLILASVGFVVALDLPPPDNAEAEKAAFYEKADVDVENAALIPVVEVAAESTKITSIKQGIESVDITTEYIETLARPPNTGNKTLLKIFDYRRSQDLA